MPILREGNYDPVEVEYDGKKEKLFGAAHSDCYPGAYWTPYGAFLECEYADYGDVEIKHTTPNIKNLFWFLTRVLQSSPVVFQGENSSHDLPFNFEEFLKKETPALATLLLSDKASYGLKTRVDIKIQESLFEDALKAWKYVWDISDKHRLFGANWKGQLHPVRFAVLHKHAFKGIIQWVSRTPSLHRRSRTMKAIFKEALEKMEKTRAIFDDKDDKYGVNLMMVAQSFMEGIKIIGHPSCVRNPDEFDYCLPSVTALLKGEVSEAELFKTIKPCLEFRWVMEGLEDLYLRLVPMTYSGQDYSNEAGVQYAALVQKTKEAIAKDLKAEDW